ncbi:MAG: hypothetical protein ACTS6G_01460 [Candidatus Hodgkinia cicadicola]
MIKLEESAEDKLIGFVSAEGRTCYVALAKEVRIVEKAERWEMLFERVRLFERDASCGSWSINVNIVMNAACWVWLK